MNPTNNTSVARIERTIRQHSLFRPGDTVVVALSGGADSVALLDLLSRLPGYNLSLVAAHLNHGLRGAESDGDQEFCRALAARYAIPFEVRCLDIGAIAAANRHNLEDTGRCARIAFFDEVRAMYSAAAVALAHHADDQAETVLIRLLRGSGMTGLSGMAYRNARGYVRPLLEMTRPEIEQYLRDNVLEWREDSSNRDTAYLRNRIRHHLLPHLEEYNPAIRAALASTATILQGDESLLTALTEQAFAASCRVGEHGVEGSIVLLRGLNPALRRRVLRHAYHQSAGTLAGLNLLHIDALCDLIDADRPHASLAFPHGVTVSREYDRVVWMKDAPPVGDAAYELNITEAGFYPLPGGGSLHVDVASTDTFRTDSHTAFFDLAVTPFPWFVRTFRPGDSLTPFGMSGRKKVKDVFIDRKIPRSERRRIPLLFCGADLMWVAGVSVSELNRMGEGARAVVKATYTGQ